MQRVTESSLFTLACYIEMLQYPVA